MMPEPATNDCNAHAAPLLCCDQRLRLLLQRRLDGFERLDVGVPDAALRHAAVALPVAECGHGPELAGMPQNPSWSDDAALLVTRRIGGLRRHAGQWALPGGRVDPGESAEQAALRELAEEIGLELGAEAVLGRLDDYITRSGYLITPVVVWAGRAEALRANPTEVASIHRIAVTELLRSDAPMLEPSRHGPHPVLRMPIGDSWIAAPTAAMLYQFREVCLLGRDTRVADFDQPDFAWR
jgi:8-oxo-dGTP pyrophosphatase MutT (NUDIX family)